MENIETELLRQEIAAALEAVEKKVNVVIVGFKIGYQLKGDNKFLELVFNHEHLPPQYRFHS